MTQITAEELKALEFRALSKLRSEYRLKECGAGKYDSFCPAHDDRGGKSLRVYRCDDGRLRFRCYAGCSFNEIRAALGLPTWNGQAIPKADFKPKPKAPKQSQYSFPELSDSFLVDGPTLAPLAERLGVSIHSLLDSEVGRAEYSPMHSHKAGGIVSVTGWSFPMVNASLECTGLRMRAEGQGGRDAKFSWTDSTPGLFVGRRWLGDGPIVICEGPTERCTAFDWGYDAIGLPSCNDGFDLLIDLLMNQVKPMNAKRPIAILANNDEPKKRPVSGEIFYPGQEGGNQLGQMLAPLWYPSIVRMAIARKGFKDYREWKRNGATRKTIDAHINGMTRYSVSSPTKRSA